MTSLAVLAADLGASSGKIARVSFDGNRILAEEERGIANRPAQIFQHSYWNVFSLYMVMVLVGRVRARRVIRAGVSSLR